MKFVRTAATSKVKTPVRAIKLCLFCFFFFFLSLLTTAAFFKSEINVVIQTLDVSYFPDTWNLI